VYKGNTFSAIIMNDMLEEGIAKGESKEKIENARKTTRRDTCLCRKNLLNHAKQCRILTLFSHKHVEERFRIHFNP
jgi:hypothetical protein